MNHKQKPTEQVQALLLVRSKRQRSFNQLQGDTIETDSYLSDLQSASPSLRAHHDTEAELT